MGSCLCKKQNNFTETRDHLQRVMSDTYLPPTEPEMSKDQSSIVIIEAEETENNINNGKTTNEREHSQPKKNKTKKKPQRPTFISLTTDDIDNNPQDRDNNNNNHVLLNVNDKNGLILNHYSPFPHHQNGKYLDSQSTPILIEDQQQNTPSTVMELISHSELSAIYTPYSHCLLVAICAHAM